MHEWMFVIMALATAGLCGFGVLAPFASRVKFIAFAAPLAGMLLVPFGANAFYSVIGTSYRISTLLSAALCIGLTIFQFRQFRPRTEWIAAALVITFVAALAVLVMDAATLRMGGPAVLFQDGTDHAGYAAVADLLNDHTAAQRPQATPDRPYESWPELMFDLDPRFGVYGLLAILSRLHRTSAMFAYDAACAAVGAAAFLAVAAAYARSWTMLVTIALGLFVSQWLDLAHAGFLGKLVAYPSALMLVGLLLNSLPVPSVAQAAAVGVLASAVGIMHSGPATTLLIAPILLMALCQIAFAKRPAKISQQAIFTVVIALALPIIASGIQARVIHFDYPTSPRGMEYAIPRALDLENWGGAGDISGLGVNGLAGFTWVALVIWLSAVVLALRWRRTDAISLLGGVMILVIALLLLHAHAECLQLVGWLYPATLCGICLLSCGTLRTAGGVAVASLLVFSIGLRLPRFVAALDRYALYQDPKSVFTDREIRELVNRIGASRVELDARDNYRVIMLLIETGEHHMNVQWSEPAWQIAVGYRFWPWPHPTVPAEFIITTASHAGGHHQFDLTPLHP